MFVLVYSDSAGVERRIDLTGDATLGRGSDADIVIEDASISRIHARLRETANGLFVTDLGSRNGTTVNGEPALEKELHSGDVLTFGRVSARIETTAVPHVTLSDGHMLLESETVVRRVEDIRRAARKHEADRFVKLITRIASALVASRTLDEVLNSILSLAFEHIPCERGFVFLETGNGLEAQIARTRHGQPIPSVSLSRTVVNRVMADRVAIMAADVGLDSELRKAPSIVGGPVRSFLVAPLWTEQRVAGVLYLDNPHSQHFASEDIELLVALTNYSAVAVERTRLTENLAREARQRERLQRYHSPAVVRRIVSQPDEGAETLSAHEHQVTVLLTDLVGFTTMVEHMPPLQVGTMLNQYFARMVDVLFEYQGTLDKFTGDGLLAVFGAPVEQPDHAVRAVRAAVGMQEALAALLRTWPYGEIRMRISLNSGLVIAGDVGSPLRREYTVLGDVVNTCARMNTSEICKPGHVVLSRSTLQAHSDPIDVKPLGEFRLRGRSEALEIFDVPPRMTTAARVHQAGS